MLLTDDYCYTATVLIKSPVDQVMKFMKDANKVGEWGFGSWKPIKQLGGGIYQGTSLYDGGKTVYKLNVYEKFHQIDYEVGYLGGELIPWIVARVTPGKVVGQDPESSLLSMMAWRNAEWSDEDWKLIGATHEAEVFRIRYLVESGN